MPIKKRLNSPNAISCARQLRRDMTWPEKLFWSRVKAQQFMNLKFRKQHPVGPFVVDFYCASVSLIVEIDGDSHKDMDADGTRQRYLEELGIKIVRYTNDEVLMELEWVMEDLARRLQGEEEIPPLTPPFQGGEQEGMGEEEIPPLTPPLQGGEKEVVTASANDPRQRIPSLSVPLPRREGLGEGLDSTSAMVVECAFRPDTDRHPMS